MLKDSLIAYPVTGAISTSSLQQAEAHKWNYNHKKGGNLKFGGADFPFSYRNLCTQQEPNLCNFTAHFPVSSSHSARCSNRRAKQHLGTPPPPPNSPSTQQPQKHPDTSCLFPWKGGNAGLFQALLQSLSPHKLHLFFLFFSCSISYPKI